jgi:ATP-binding cassette subfamily A (ABC1) protein 3
MCSQLVAVDGASFGLEYGDCFTLLGVNGAGKSTTFKSLTNEIVPTSGNVSINDLDIQQQFSQVRRMIGYCPQENVIFDRFTVEEHLEYYCRIKGIINFLRSRIIE